MQAYSHSGPASTVASVSDLDGYTLPFNSYTPMENDDFGFDPPAEKIAYPKIETYSPPEPMEAMIIGDWPDFERREEQKYGLQSYEIDKRIAEHLPNADNAISRFGQVTPPRTNSTDSGGRSAADSTSASPKSSTHTERKKRASKAIKQESHPVTSASGRKRKASRKAAVIVEDQSTGGPEDVKRKASLEKNRLAAAKCRVNKKEKTEQLQRDSHDKAVHNAFLKDQVMHMKEQIQQMNAVLLAHANCKGCKAPDEIQKHLSQLSNDFLANQIHHSVNAAAYGDYPQMSLDDMAQSSMISDSYFPSLEHDSLNPPLPDFDRSVDFEAGTPMATD